MPNRFTSKMAQKSSTELREIVKKNSEFVQDAKDAAQIELDKRKDEGSLLSDEEEKEIRIQKHLEDNKPHGEELYKDFVKQINTRNAEIEFETKIPSETIHIIAIKAFEKLEWDVVHFDERIVEAKRPQFETWTEKLYVTIDDNQRITVRCKSLNQKFEDNYINSQRVHLFQHVFKEIESTHTAQSLNELKSEVDKEKNWENYVIPDRLPDPKDLHESNFNKILLPAIFGTIVISIVFGFLVKAIHIIIAFEVGVGYLIGQLIQHGIKTGNYTNRKKLQTLCLALTFLTIFIYQLIDYLYLTSKLDINVSYLEFKALQIEAGLHIKSFNTGPVGFVILLILQPIIIYFASWLQVSNHIVKYEATRVPFEVLEFVHYCVFKEKNEDEIKLELYKKGWIDESLQNQAIQAFDSNLMIREQMRAE